MNRIKYIHPNQKLVTIHKAPTDKDHVYGVLNKDAMYEACNNLSHNELKLFLYLSSNQDDYYTALSTGDIANKVGAGVDGIRTAVKGLSSKGYLVKKHGNSFDFFEAPQKNVNTQKEKLQGKSGVGAQENNAPNTGKPRVYNGENRGEIIKEDYSKSTLDYIESEKLISNSFINSEEWKRVFGKVKVNAYAHTIRELERVVGEYPDTSVIERIIDENWSAFEKGMSEKEGYRFHTLTNLARTKYDEVKARIAEEENHRYNTEDAWYDTPFDYIVTTTNDCKERKQNYAWDTAEEVDHRFDIFDDLMLTV